MPRLHTVTLLASLLLTMAAATAPPLGIPCKTMLSTQSQKLLSSTTPALLASQLLPADKNENFITSLTQQLKQLPHCETLKHLHADLLHNPKSAIFFPTDSTSAIPSLFTAKLMDDCAIFEVGGVYRVFGIDDTEPGPAYLHFRGARMVAFDVFDEAEVRLLVKVICDGEEVGNVDIGVFEVRKVREMLGRAFMVGRIGDS